MDVKRDENVIFKKKKCFLDDFYIIIYKQKKISHFLNVIKEAHVHTLNFPATFTSINTFKQQ